MKFIENFFGHLSFALSMLVTGAITLLPSYAIYLIYDFNPQGFWQHLVALLLTLGFGFMQITFLAKFFQIFNGD